MILNRIFHIFIALTLFIFFSNCGGDPHTGAGVKTSSHTNGKTLPQISGSNVVPLTVNGNTCAVNSYFNKPCVSITICAPGSTSNCQTISDILVDTGSSGFRIFNSALNSSVASALTAITAGSNDLAECIPFGDGSSTWGPVKTARLVLGNTAVSQIPIQVIDSAFAGAGRPGTCATPDTDPASAGYTGILGVGLFKHDCGDVCSTFGNNSVYYSCTSSSCAETTATLAQQVANPVGTFSQNNNGIILELPSIDTGGVVSMNGYLVLGIGTQSNNSASGVITFPTDQSGEFITNFNNKKYNGLVDSGSNALYFESPSSTLLPRCTTTNITTFFCPTSIQTFSANNQGTSGSPSSNISFQIGNLLNLLEADSGANNVFIESGGTESSAGNSVFIWGLPFYIGRNVYIGLDGASSSLGTGPYWAF